DDPRHLAHALILLLTLGGTPAVYAGDEQGMRGVKEERYGGDDAIRPTFPPAPTELAPGGWEVYHLHQELIALRRRNPWLHRARTEVLTCTNTELVYRAVGEGDSLVVVLNLGDGVVGADVSPAAAVLAGHNHARLDGGRVHVAGHGWAVVGG
ncbi:MAG TPA: DUF3459 domain-containing protein, partial [Propionicimonas sp.]